MKREGRGFRRTKRRTDGRSSVTLTVKSPDETTRRAYFYGRTQAEAKPKAEARERLAQGRPDLNASHSVSEWLAE